MVRVEMQASAVARGAADTLVDLGLWRVAHRAVFLQISAATLPRWSPPFAVDQTAPF